MLALRPFTTPSLSQLRRELDNLFDSVFRGFDDGLFGGRPFPALNLWEDGQALYVEAEVPGLTMDDIDVSIDGNELVIKGQRKLDGGENVTYHRRERGAGEFIRYLTLPVEVDADRVEATLKHGVLTIVMPKSEAARARKITVKGQ